MKRLIPLLLACAAASPGLAQHVGHGPIEGAQSAPVSQPPAAAPSAGCTAEHAAMGHCTMSAPPPPPPPPTSTCTAEHAAMGHCKMPAPAPISTAAQAPCTPEHAAMGHCRLPESVPSPATAPTSPPAPACTAEHAAMGHCSLPAAPPVRANAPACTAEHAAMGHCRLPDSPPAQPAADPHSGHGRGQGPSTPSADPHAGHDMAAGQAVVPEAPPPPEAVTGPAHAADLVFDPVEMARARAQLAHEHGGLEAQKFLVDRLEVQAGEGRENYAWDAQFWYGSDIDKVWLKTEGEGAFGGEFEGVELQGLWSHAIDPWFDLQAGVRQDLGPGPDRTHLVLGAQGLAPYWFELEGALFLSTRGEVTASFEAEYDLRLTQRLILQPEAEIDFSLQDVPELGLGTGLTRAEVGARLRYEFYPGRGPAVIAPYVGILYERSFGGTADYRRATGEAASGLRVLLGVRTWF